MNNSYYLLTNLLTEEEKSVITCIVEHIEKKEKRVGIQQIANENFVSPTFIMKMCKRLGFDGYSELFYHLSMQVNDFSSETRNETIHALIDDYKEDDGKEFARLLECFRDQKMFSIGSGFSDLVADYIVQRLAICGFMVFNSVHFYDFMLFHEERKGLLSNVEPSMVIAISQSGESDTVINDVKRARQQGFRIVSFTKRKESTLALLSDICFVVDGAKQTLIGGIPNPFFGKVILAFEELMGVYFRGLSEPKNG